MKSISSYWILTSEISSKSIQDSNIYQNYITSDHNKRKWKWETTNDYTKSIIHSKLSFLPNKQPKSIET